MLKQKQEISKKSIIIFKTLILKYNNINQNLRKIFVNYFVCCMRLLACKIEGPYMYELERHVKHSTQYETMDA